MRVERLELTNFRGIRHLELEFPTQTTVLVGINGVGKSAILDALAVLLQVLSTELVRSPGPFLMTTGGLGPSADHDIRVGADSLTLSIQASEGGDKFSWRRTTSGRRWEFDWEHSDLEALVGHLRKKQLFPLVVQYATSRGQWSETSHLDNSRVSEPADAFRDAYPAGRKTFDAFYAWFREREDIENEERAKDNRAFLDPQLEAVRTAVAALLQGFSHLRIERKRKRMTVQKNEEILDVTQLSSGEKALLTLVSDLARRLSILNPIAADPRLSEGVVLIDEVDLHLHPRWQRMLLPALERTFPHCQFIVTTHSPQVISEVKPECIYLLERKDGETVARRPESSFGLDSNRILEDLMGVDERPRRIKEQLIQFFRLIDDGKLDEAKALRRQLEEEIGSDEPSFAKGDVLIRRKEMLTGAPHRPQR
ncbi:AAA family ATPase [Hyalangium versicolor]|uniref:AAA family ATPase n=1 Tax=Hyalangium versicolor TaxID=2861190 RepID=UPI001CCDA1E6|nr:AAA family ATPase [Hyalangium versicolor]